MNRRNFLQTTSAACAGLAFSKSLPAFADALATSGWRTFEVACQSGSVKPNGMTHIWLPSALIVILLISGRSNKFSAENGTAKLTKDKSNALGLCQQHILPTQDRC